MLRRRRSSAGPSGEPATSATSLAAGRDRRRLPGASSVASVGAGLRSGLGRYREIWYALLAIAGITALYLLAYRQHGSLPRASGLIGHGIGVAGFVLMLMTETLYSIRKRVTDASWGKMSSWLRFHIFTGLVGPYMVLLHTAMVFTGLAGLAMLLTVVVVVSGVIGRYIYTSIPRTIDPDPPAASAAATEGRARRLAARRKALATWHSVHVPLTMALFTIALLHAIAALYYATLQR
jgi:hypothetical protein